MKPKVRYFDAVDADLDDFSPEDPEDFWVPIQVIVGPADDAKAEELIQFTVCTPKALQAAVAREGFLMGRSLVIVDSADMVRIKEFITTEIEKIEAPTYAGVGVQLAWLGNFEFEDNAIS
ncbi:Imm8 family immunity protein [Amycolatopsis saalfeldensis]|uniref:Immunity protein 8 n=1 Tax=Amycolatopsis saalfeldensis TaxID=394193 RepID=A0A1H8XZR8_9PSEU|nr:Imm8 family immunity protein [Amycolatopsis saalfeldensis]SEP45379.1 Immunity protein 8 [Amycolatopsis saalfeldensis]